MRRLYAALFEISTLLNGALYASNSPYLSGSLTQHLPCELSGTARSAARALRAQLLTYGHSYTIPSALPIPRESPSHPNRERQVFKINLGHALSNNAEGSYLAIRY